MEFCISQAIQNQAEMDALRKKLALCLEEKEKIERLVVHSNTCLLNFHIMPVNTIKKKKNQ